MKEGWEYKRMDEVCSIARGGSPRPIKDYITNDPNGLNWIKIGDTDMGGKYIYSTKEKIKPEGLKKSRWVEEDEFLLSNSMSFGRPYILKTNGCIHDGWLVLRDYQKYLNIDFFYYVLSSENVQRQFRIKAQGSTVSNLNTDRVASVTIPIPPLSEQQSIVDYLDSAFAKIDAMKANAEKRLNEAQALFQASLKEMLEPKEGWEEKSMKEIVHPDCSLSYGIVQPGEHIDDGVPVVRPVDFNNKVIVRVEGLKRTKKEISDAYKRTILKGGEILLCVRGTTGTMGVASDELQGCNVTRGIVPIFFDEHANKMFVYYQLLSPKLQTEIQKKTTGAALKQINIKDLRALHLFFPSLSEQQAIVATLNSFKSKVDKLQANYEKISQECDALKQAILRQVFE